MESAASMEDRVKASQGVPEKMKRLETSKEQVRVLALVRCDGCATGSSVVMTI